MNQKHFQDKNLDFMLIIKKFVILHLLGINIMKNYLFLKQLNEQFYFQLKTLNLQLIKFRIFYLNLFTK